MRYNTYIFDLDGTLLNTLDDLASSANYALAKHHMPTHTTEMVRQSVGNGVSKLIERLVPNGTANPAYPLVVDTFRSHYLSHHLDNTAPYPGILPMLAELRQRGRQVAVVSNKFQDATAQLCGHFFPGLVDVAIGESDTIRRKPSPDGVLHAMRLLGSHECSTVYIGDSDVDIATARACQLPCISVLWGFRNKQFLLQHGATTFIDNPNQLLCI